MAGELNAELLQLIIKDWTDVYITNYKNLKNQQKLNALDLISIELNTKGNQYAVTFPIIQQTDKHLLSNKFRQQLKKRKKIFYIIWGESQS